MNKRYALCIGNNYPGTDSELSGCVNDAHDWADLLAREGYDVTVLTETPKAVAVERLKAMVAKAGWGDRIVFTYSGHGSWIPDRSGDEADHRDEVMCMADFRNGGLLVDDEIQQIFSALKSGVGALTLSDSCFSASVNRVVGPVVKGTSRFMSPAKFTDLTERQVEEMEKAVPSLPRPTTSLISGCADVEFSYDAWFENDTRANGAFTRAAIDTYQRGASLARWYNRIREQLPSDAYPQSPELTAQNLYRKYVRAI